MSEVRMVSEQDLPYLKQVLDTIELFPSDMLDDMISAYFNDPQSEDIWFTATENDQPIAIGYCAPEKLTDGTYNLHAIGVRGDIQGKGTGSKMMVFIEDHLRSSGKRILLVDTSGTDAFAGTRAFYERLGYAKVAVIRDFWADGDDKVTFLKGLN
ncbi:MAG: GNAT family N-acetyltransferase [Bacteroidota bacterium]